MSRFLVQPRKNIDFYSRTASTLATELIGCIFVKQEENAVLAAQITEVEAYTGFDDPADHAHNGKTNRNASLFLDAGHLYVHSIHRYFCVDIVCDTVDVPGSVLIRRSEDGVVEVIEKFILKGAMSKTITICSSMQFTSEIRAAQVQLEALGYTVLTPELSEKSVEYLNLPLEAQRAAKRTFIANHFARIAQSDAIVVLNYEKKGVKGYIGSNTLMEIGVAYSLGKKIYLLHPLGEQGCSEEVLALATAVLDGTLKVLEKEAR